MKSSKRKLIHEAFHSQTRSQKRVLGRDNFTYRKLLSLLDKHIYSHSRILDVGCGSGTLSLYLADKGNKVVGIDISEKAVKKCRVSAQRLNLNELVTFQAMDFPQQTPVGVFDSIICTEVIEHLRNDDLAFQKLSSLVKKGGVVIISTPSKNAPLYKLGFATDFDKRVGHLRRYTMSELKDKAEAAGFTVMEEYKTEGILRNFLFLNSYAGFLLRFVRFHIADFVTAVDDVSCRLFGESDLILVLKK